MPSVKLPYRRGCDIFRAFGNATTCLHTPTSVSPCADEKHGEKQVFTRVPGEREFATIRRRNQHPTRGVVGCNAAESTYGVRGRSRAQRRLAGAMSWGVERLRVRGGRPGRSAPTAAVVQRG